MSETITMGYVAWYMALKEDGFCLRGRFCSTQKSAHTSLQQSSNYNISGVITTAVLV